MVTIGSFCGGAARFALRVASVYIAKVFRPNPMKRRRIIVLAVAVALAFAGGNGPRHAQATAQDHDHSASAETTHSHAQHQSGDTHSHDHDHGAAAASQFGEGAKHDHAGTPPTSDQGCCYAWCNSVAIIHATDGLAMVASHDDHFTSEQPFRIAAFSSAIDPPPR
jgi:hypothetical protein